VHGDTPATTTTKRKSKQKSETKVEGMPRVSSILSSRQGRHVLQQSQAEQDLSAHLEVSEKVWLQTHHSMEGAAT
jgi:hypothetical protein